MSRPCVGLIGWAPPPWGGISVHVSRLAKRLSADGFRVVLIDLSHESETLPNVVHSRVRHRPWAIEAAVAARRERCDLIHMHTMGVDWRAAFEMALLQEALSVPVYVSIHSLRPDEGRFAFLRGQAFAAACNRLAQVVASGEAVAQRLVSLGVLPHRVRTVVAHVRDLAPPGALPGDVEDFARAHSPLVTAGANALRRWRGLDLYGFDVFVEAAARVLVRYPNAGFVFLLPRAGDPGLCEAALERAEALGIARSLLVIHEALPDASAVWARGDVFVRPTRDDGDALSVRESLDMAVPVLASDTVPRPAGVRLFRTANVEDCATALLRMLGDLPTERAQVAALARPPDGADMLAPMYRASVRTWS
jgi:glycogen(starch) synthase